MVTLKRQIKQKKLVITLKQNNQKKNSHNHKKYNQTILMHVCLFFSEFKTFFFKIQLNKQINVEIPQCLLRKTITKRLNVRRN